MRRSEARVLDRLRASLIKPRIPERLMLMTTRRWTILGCLGCALAAVVASVHAPPSARADERARADPGLDRARRQVKMLDDLYKTAVVAITERYKTGPPAIMVAKDVFGAMEGNGWHSARLVDASGSPIGENSEPKTDFEKKAAEAMRAGQPYYEEVAGEGDHRRLLAATVVPAVLPRCASCHGTEQGDLLGFIRYELPID